MSINSWPCLNINKAKRSVAYCRTSLSADPAVPRESGAIEIYRGLKIALKDDWADRAAHKISMWLHVDRWRWNKVCNHNGDGICLCGTLCLSLFVGSTGAAIICSVFTFIISLYFKSSRQVFLYKLCWHHGILLDKHHLSLSPLLVNFRHICQP